MLNILRIISLILIMGATTGAGFVYGESMRKRVNQLKEMEIILYNLKNQIEFTNTSLPEAMDSASENAKGPVKEIFKEISRMLFNFFLEDVFQAFNISIASNKDKTCLTKEDINILVDFSKSIGNMDIAGQRSIFNLTLENIKKQINEAENTLKKNVKMYRYLGFSIGAMIDIMII